MNLLQSYLLYLPVAHHLSLVQASQVCLIERSTFFVTHEPCPESRAVCLQLRLRLACSIITHMYFDGCGFPVQLVVQVNNKAATNRTNKV